MTRFPSNAWDFTLRLKIPQKPSASRKKFTDLRSEGFVALITDCQESKLPT
jgi:hypothetical protein